MKLSVLKEYLPWNLFLDYLEYRRYQRWLKDNYRKPLRPKRGDGEIVSTGIDFMTNAPQLTRLRTHVGNPYKKPHA